MKLRHSITLAALLCIARSAWAVEVESVTPTPSSALHWQGRHQLSIDAKRISAERSIRLVNCSDIVISACDVRSIELIGCKRITIRNSYIHDSKRNGVDIEDSTDVLVQGCRIERVSSGVYALESTGIQVVGNFVRNVRGPMPRGQMAQFDKVYGSNNAIRGNFAINDRGRSAPEDMISLYKSAGVEASPILVEDNYLYGDPLHGSAGKSRSGSGIMLGDSGGDRQVARRNVVIGAGQVGIGVAGGRNIRVEHNLIYGGKTDIANTGLYVWNQSRKSSFDIIVSGNRVRWFDRRGHANPWWYGGGVKRLSVFGNTFDDASLDTQLPPPPTRSPMPPTPWVTRDEEGRLVARLPW